MDDELGNELARKRETDEKERLLAAIEVRRACLEENSALKRKLEARIDELKLVETPNRIVGDNADLRAEIEHLKGEQAVAKRDYEARRSELKARIAKISEECETLRGELD